MPDTQPHDPPRREDVIDAAVVDDQPEPGGMPEPEEPAEPDPA